MNRRNILGLAASLPLVASTAAVACTPTTTEPRDAGLVIVQVRKLFRAWWDRDEEAFKGCFTDLLSYDGTPLEPSVAKGELALDPLDPNAFAIFSQYFTSDDKLHALDLIVETASGVVVACSEQDLSPSPGVGGECPTFPTQHLFLITMKGPNPRAVVHLASKETIETSKFSIWTGQNL